MTLFDVAHAVISPLSYLGKHINNVPSQSESHEQEHNENPEHFSTSTSTSTSTSAWTPSRILFNILALLCAVYAVYLSWNCSTQSSMVARVLYAMLAFFFSWIYLIYYAIVHLGIGVACQ